MWQDMLPTPERKVQVYKTMTFPGMGNYTIDGAVAENFMEELLEKGFNESEVKDYAPVSVAYQTLADIVREKEGLKPEHENWLKEFSEMAKYSVWPTNGTPGRNYSEEVSKLLMQTTDYYSSKGTETAGTKREALASNLLSFAMKIWGEYEGAVDVQATEEDWKNEISGGMDLNGGSYNTDLGELGGMFTAISNYQAEAKKAVQSPEFHLAIGAYLAYQALGTRGPSALKGVTDENMEKFQGFHSVAMLNSDYMNAVDTLARSNTFM